MVHRYIPKGVCATEILVDINEITIKSVEVIDGCAGNSLGIAKLVEGMNVNDAINKLKGIKCDYKVSSCPDQLAKALEEAMMKKVENTEVAT